jgi:5S rRNA maturation endonuclease (ribonuclease M5)
VRGCVVTAEEIAKALKGKKDGRGWKACCPAHDDNNPSFTVSDGDKGGAVFHCFAGCTQEEVMSALERRGLWNTAGSPKVYKSSANILDFNSAPRQRIKQQPKPKREFDWDNPSAVYEYTDSSGQYLYSVLRNDFRDSDGNPDKDFRHGIRQADGSWVKSIAGTPRVLYRWLDLVAYPDATVFVTEGEKDAIRVSSLGYCSTTVASHNWNVDVSCIKGRDVIVLEDADKPGIKEAAKAAAKLHGLAKTLRVVRLPGHEYTADDHGKDVSDWLDEDPTRADTFVEMCLSMPVWVPPEEAPSLAMDEEQQVGAALKLTHFNECDKTANKVWLIKDFLAKGETSGLFGPPGSGKSALETDIAVALACGEDFRGFKTKHRVGAVYFAFERADLTKRRLHAYRIRDGHDDIPISVAGEIINLMRPECVEIMSATIKAHEDHYGTECGYVILDTAAKGIAIAGGDEDKAKDVNRCLANLRRIHELHNLHMSLIGHTGKDESRGQRGSNAAPGDYDLHIQISGEDTKTATVIKANDQPCGPLLAYRMHKVILGHNDDGDEISTWIVDREEAEVPTKKSSFWHRNLLQLFDAINNALTESGFDFPIPNGPTVRAVLLENVRAAYRRSYIVGPDSKNPEEAINKALTRALRAARDARLIAGDPGAGKQIIWVVKEPGGT